MKIKDIIITFAAVFFSIFLTSCQKEATPENALPDGDAVQDLCVSVDGITVGTKAGQGNEDKLNTVQLMLFSGDELYRHYSLTSAEISDKSVTVANVKIGDYTLALVANGPSDLSTTVTSLSGLKARTLLLKDYNATGSGFVMYGTTSVTVTADATANASVTLKRHVGRVVVSKITNGIPAAYGSLTVNNIMLTNVYANVTMEGKAVSSGAVWYNMEGRSDTSSPLTESHIIDGSSYTSQCADLTFRTLSSPTIANGGSYSTSPQYLYGYVNGSTATPAGFVATYPSAGYKTCLVVTATFNGHKWYYPVVIDSLAANTTYDVQLTIVGEGSTDPNTPVKKGSVKTKITVAEWTTGTSYDKTI